MYWLARAVVKKYYKLMMSTTDILFSYSSGGWQSETQVSAGVVYFEGRENLLQPLCQLLVASGTLGL